MKYVSFLIYLKGGKSMGERTLAFRIDEEFHKALKVRLAQQGVTLKSYIFSLIKKDMEENSDFANISQINKSARIAFSELQKIVEMSESK